MDPQLIFFGVIIVVIIALMFRNGRKRQKDQAALSEGLKPGAEVMTSFGVFGTILHIDDAENRITLSTGPGSEMTIHRQAVGRVVSPVTSDDVLDGGTASDTVSLEKHPVVLDDAAADPQFGQRIDSDDAAARRSKPDGE